MSVDHSPMSVSGDFEELSFSFQSTFCNKVTPQTCFSRAAQPGGPPHVCERNHVFHIF